MAPNNSHILAFDDSTVVVITGSSRGIGLQLVKAFLEITDSQVVATARNVAKASELHSIAASFQGRVQLVNLDTESEDSVKAAAAEVASKHDGIDLLVNNAAIMDGFEVSPLELSPVQYEQILKVNVVGPFITTKSFLPLLRKKHSRVVVNTSSIGGSIAHNRQGTFAVSALDGTPLYSRLLAYGSSKSALNMQNSILANALKDEDFTFLALCPGWTDTDMGGKGKLDLPANVAPPSAEISAKQQLEVLKGLTRQNNGDFVNYQGKIDW